MKYAHGQYIDLVRDPYDHAHVPEYVRGHVTEQEAREALNRFERGMGDGTLTIEHKFGRFVFSQSDEYDHELKVYSIPQRGAFKLTEVR